MLSVRKATVIFASTAVMAAVGAPAAMAQSSTTDYPSDTATQQDRPAKQGNKRRAGRQLSNAQLATVATKLGVSLDALKAAMAKAKTATAATDKRETRGEQDALLAGELGLTATQVREAFASVERRRGSGDCQNRPSGSSGQGADYPTDA